MLRNPPPLLFSPIKGEDTKAASFLSCDKRLPIKLPSLDGTACPLSALCALG